jgi:NAD(P)-dependent dehydrogenase (short-subunit alcohol dehydrogenase family)
VLLENRNAVIYGGGGSIGGAVARAFAREGARVHLAGRTRDSLERVADEIRSAGGTAETAQVDALDEAAVDEHADAMAASAGSIDISFNLISHGDVQGTPLAEMRLEDFERPVATAVRTMFLTSRAAARHMIRQRSGVILVFGGYGDPPAGHNLGGLQVAFGAMESLRRNLARELGPYGIRVVTLQTGGVPDSIPEGFAWRQAITDEIAGGTMLNRAATLDDVGNVAVFAASDWARTITASALNITGGSVVG